MCAKIFISGIYSDTMHQSWIAATIIALLILVFVVSSKKKSEKFLIYPYLDLANGGYRGDPYALLSCTHA